MDYSALKQEMINRINLNVGDPLKISNASQLQNFISQQSMHISDAKALVLFSGESKINNTIVDTKDLAIKASQAFEGVGNINDTAAAQLAEDQAFKSYMRDFLANDLINEGVYIYLQ